MLGNFRDFYPTHTAFIWSSLITVALGKKYITRGLLIMFLVGNFPAERQFPIHKVYAAEETMVLAFGEQLLPSLVAMNTQWDFVKPWSFDGVYPEGTRRAHDKEQDLTWGVLALNPDKAIYKPGETAFAQVAIPPNVFIHDGGSFMVASEEIKEFNGGLRIIRGTFINRGEMTVTKEFTLGKDARFVNKGALNFSDRDGEMTINVEKRARTIIIPARYGPRYSITGAVLFGTGALITATGSRIELFTPSLGIIHITP